MLVVAQSPSFIISEDFVQVSAKFFEKENYMNDFKKVSKWSSDDILSLANSVLENKDVLFYVNKNNFKNIITIERSKILYTYIINNKEVLSKEVINFNKELGELLYSDYGEKKFNDYFYFYFESNVKIREDLIQNLPNWGNQYWISIDNITYHISIKSVNGLRIEDVLIEIK